MAEHHELPAPTTSNLDSASLTPFAHGAAGHQGLSSNASGSLIIKPCTQAEIDFYESAKLHPEFQAHMPTYMGSLTLNPNPSVASMLEQGGSSSTGVAPERTQETGGDEQAAEASQSKKDEPWVPSGGKKLSTGLAIVLENATTGFKRPHVLDLKIGSRLWADDAPEAKRQKLDQVAAETTTGSLGFRVAGMKIWLPEGDNLTAKEIHTEIKDGYRSFDKFYGRSLTAETVSEAFVKFIGGQVRPGREGDGVKLTRKRAPLLLQRLVRELESIQYVLEQEESRMYSASILVVAEGDDDALEAALVEERRLAQRVKSETGEADDSGNDAEEDDNGDEDEDEEEDTGPRVLEVRLIDFAHALWTPGQGPDENALKGVRNIRRIVEELSDSVS